MEIWFSSMYAAYDSCRFPFESTAGKLFFCFQLYNRLAESFRDIWRRKGQTMTAGVKPQKKRIPGDQYMNFCRKAEILVLPFGIRKKKGEIYHGKQV